MSIFTEPKNSTLSPSVLKAIENIKKQKQQKALGVIAAPDIIKNQIKTVENEQPSVTPIENTNVVQSVVPNQNIVSKPQINDEYRGNVTDAYRSNNPDYNPLTTDKQIIQQNPSINNAIEHVQPKVVIPKTSKDFIKLPKEQQEKLKQELADSGHWDVNDKFDAEKALNSYYASQPAINTPASQTSSSSSSTTKTVEESALPEMSFDKYVQESGYNPINLLIDGLKPKRKETTEERLKQIAAANAIGDGLRLIGDAVYGDKGSIGANIPKRDNKYTYKAIEDMNKLKDKYESDDKNYGMLKLQQLMKLRNEWLSNKSRKETLQSQRDIATAKLLAEADKSNKKLKNDMDIAKLKAGVAQRIANTRASAGSGANKNKTTLLYKKGNKVIPIDNSYFNDILANILAEKNANGDDKFVNAVLESMQKDPSQTKAKALVQENWEKWYKPNGDYTGIEPRTDVKPIQQKKYFTFDEIINKEKQRIPLETQQTVVKNITSDPNLSKEQKAQAIYSMILESGVNGEYVSEDEAYNVAMSLLND